MDVNTTIKINNTIIVLSVIAIIVLLLRLYVKWKIIQKRDPEVQERYKNIYLERKVRDKNGK